MTVSTEVTRVIVEGDGSTTVFSYAFPIVGSTSTDQTNADLWITDTNGVSTNLADNLWSITGVVSVTPIDGTATGTFTYPLMGSPLAVGNFLTLERTQPYLQPTTLSAQGAYSPAVVEAALDNLALQTEQLNTWRLQSVRAPITDAALNDLPPAALRAGAFLRFDDNGQPSTASSTSGLPASIYVGTNSTSATLTTTLLTTGTAVTSVVTVAGVTTATIDAGGGGGGGGLVLVEHHTASSSATLDFTTGISSTYDVYEMQFAGLHNATNNWQMRMEVSTNSGSTWISSSTYEYNGIYAYQTSTGFATASTGDTNFKLSGTDTSNASTASFDGFLKWYNLNSTSLYKRFAGQIMLTGGGGVSPVYATLFGQWDSAVAVNAIRLLVSTGSFATGAAYLYGYAKS